MGLSFTNKVFPYKLKLAMIKTATQPPAKVFYSLTHTSPAGPLMLGFTEDGALCRVSFAASAAPRTILAAWRKEWPETIFEEKKEVGALFEAPFPGDILLVGTAFQIKVWKQLLKIPCGKTISYGEMARRVGKPGAARAVGTALGKNPVPLLVPCHRVIAADGSIGGFSGGLRVKTALLTIEKAVFRKA